MIIDERNQQNRVKRSKHYVERDFVWLQSARAFFSPKNYLLGGLK